jgi:hypothetical protein
LSLGGFHITKKVYEGIIEKKDADNSNLYIKSYKKPLKMIIQRDLEKYGNYLIAKYWISDKRLHESELDEKFIYTYYNALKENKTLYFEISEYLWKDEGKGCKHDLIGELASYIDKYCRLEIYFSKEPQSTDKSFI